MAVLLAAIIGSMLLIGCPDETGTGGDMVLPFIGTWEHTNPPAGHSSISLIFTGTEVTIIVIVESTKGEVETREVANYTYTDTRVTFFSDTANSTSFAYTITGNSLTISDRMPDIPDNGLGTYTKQ